MRLAKEAHFKRSAEDMGVPGKRTTIRPSEAGARPARTDVGYEQLRVPLCANRQRSAHVLPLTKHKSTTVLKHCSLHRVMLARSQGEGAQLYGLSRLLGYVSMALRLACTNASLVGSVSGARSTFPTDPLGAGSPTNLAWHPGISTIHLR